MTDADVAEDQAEQDLSMEEILQSIRKIIAEEGDGAAPAKEPPNPPTNGAAKMDAVEDEPVPGSDVLELTDMVAEPPPPQETAPPPPARDIMADIDQALAPPAATADHSPHALLSAAASAASAAAFKRLSLEVDAANQPQSPAFRSGNTVEDLVLETLRPMLKAWLDANLPGIVERIVTKEVRKLTVPE